MNREEKDLIMLIATLILPPLGVYLKIGVKPHFWLNILLTLFGWLPGVAHGLYVLLKQN
jgi:uncharacterized membrane protein YqaE (UPF0057 family)